MEKRMKEVVDTSYKLLINKINHGSIKVDNEAGFQLQFAYILKSLGQLYEHSNDERFSIELEKNIDLESKSAKSNTKKAKIDIFLELKNKDDSYKCAIELKYFKKDNHAEPNNRYKAFADISNLEKYKLKGIDICYFIIGTDHEHYVNQDKYKESAKDFDFRDGAQYTKGKKLVYKTETPEGPPITLNNSYEFKWDKFKNLYFLKLEV